MKKFRLRKYQIIKKKNIFQRVYKEGRSFVSRYLVLYVFKSEKEAEKKVGFAAGKKLGNAVTRNRLKRLMRESYRRQSRLIKDGLLLLLVARKASVEIKEPVMEKSFVALLRKAKIIKNV
ncbi:MAG: ribonuclease P protein component [Schwartzia sp.]|nr:ribonuclease P protein component [Schwartzia sp. (in: firmicutes)]